MQKDCTLPPNLCLVNKRKRACCTKAEVQQALVIENDTVISFQKTSRWQAWKDFVQDRWFLLKCLDLDPIVFESEIIFREFATVGRVEGMTETSKRIQELDDTQFSIIQDFMDDYFDMDVLHFEDYIRGSA